MTTGSTGTATDGADDGAASGAPSTAGIPSAAGTATTSTTGARSAADGVPAQAGPRLSQSHSPSPSPSQIPTHNPRATPTPDDDYDRMLFWGHSGPVHAVAYSPDGRFLAAGGFGKAIRVYRAGGEPYRALRGHLDWVNGVAFSPDSGTLASGSADWTVRLWDPVTGADRGSHQEHQDWVRGVAFSPSGRLLASAGADGRVVLWNLQQSRATQTIEVDGWVNTVVFHPAGNQLAFAGDDGRIHLWDMRKRKETTTLGGGHGYVRSIAFDGDRGLIAGAASDGTVTVWSLADGRSVATWKSDPRDVVRAVAFHADGRLALGGVRGGIRLWRPGDTRPVAPFDGRSSYVNALAFDPSCTFLASASEDDKVRLWSVPGRHLTAELQLHDGGIGGLAFTRNGRLLASGGSNRSVRVWNVEDGSLVHERERHEAWVNAVAFHPHDDSLLASASGDKTARLWDLGTNSPDAKMVFGGHDGFVRALAFHPSGRLLATGCSDTRVRVFDVATGQLHAGLDLEGHRSQVNAVAFHPDGNLLASASHDETVRLWRLTAAGNAGNTGNAGNASNASNAGNAGSPGSTAPRDNALPAETLDSAEISANALILRHRERVNTVAFSLDGTMLATGSGDKLVTLWDTATGERLAELAGHREFVRVVAFHPKDPDLLASASADRTIRLWSLSGRRPPRELSGHDDWIRCLAFTPDGSTLPDGGTMLASGGADGTIRLWDPRTGELVRGTRRTAGPGSRVNPARTAASVVLASDEPSEEDRIGFARDVEILAQLIAAVQTRPPLAIALPGRWGAGKSSFMRQLGSRIGALANASRQERGFSVFVPRVCQVHFNAWHYSDGQVLVGIAEQLFRALDAELNARPGQPGRTVDEWAEENHRALQERDDALAVVDRVQSAINHAETSRRGLLAARLRLALPAVLSFAAAAGLYAVERTFAELAAGVGLLSAAVAYWRDLEDRRSEVEKMRRLAGSAAATVRDLRHPGTQVLEALNSELDDARQRLRDAEARVEDADVLGRLAGLVSEVSSDAAFAEAGGLTHRIRERLEDLDRFLAQADDRWLDSDETGLEPPPSRVVLYVDDLDRCSPRQVVDVLAAVHLLLAFRLFVVVVPIDPRWVLRCLSVHHEHMKAAGDEKATEAASWDYLDKIFQIPFAIPLFDDAAAQSYVGHLVANALAAPVPVLRPSNAPAFQPLSPADQNGTDPSGPAAPPIAPTEGDTPDPHEGDLMPRGLELTEREARTLMQVSFLTPTPRAAKKLVNLYRLVRMGVPHLDDFLRDDCRYTVVQLLLAVIVSAPALADDVFDLVLAGKGPKIGDVFTEALTRHKLLPANGAAPLAWQAVRARLDAAGTTEVMPVVAEWAPQLRRFSFHSWKSDTTAPVGGWGPFRRRGR